MFTIKVKSQDDKNKKEYNVEISNHGKTNVKGSKNMNLRGPKNTWGNFEFSCDCPDFTSEKNKSKYVCKHIGAVILKHFYS